MTRKIYINGEVVEVEQSKIRAGELLKLAGKDPDKYELQLRRGDKGPVSTTYGRDDIVDVDSECAGAAAGPGSPDGEGSREPANVEGGGSAAGPGGPGAGDIGGQPGASEGRPGGGDAAGTTTATTTTDYRQGCYFTTRYTGPINPA